MRRTRLGRCAVDRYLVMGRDRPALFRPWAVRDRSRRLRGLGGCSESCHARDMSRSVYPARRRRPRSHYAVHVSRSDALSGVASAWT